MSFNTIIGGNSPADLISKIISEKNGIRLGEFEILLSFHVPTKKNVPEVLNVHVNETNKKIYFFRRIFFKQWKINFWEKNVIFKYFYIF